ncbi:MAG: hypothetical protein WKF40_03300 [Thermoleophilaceae bacterium]
MADAQAWVFAPDDAQDGVPYDQPEVQGARQAALAWWYGILGDALVCHTTLALDESRCAGAITVVRGDVPAPGLQTIPSAASTRRGAFPAPYSAS